MSAKRAFVIAPLVVPVSLALIFYFGVRWSLPFVIYTGIISLVVSYAGMFALGVPAYRYFKSRNQLRLSIALLYGFFSAVFVWIIFIGILFPLLLGENPFAELAWSSVLSIADPVAGLMGIFVVLIFWAIANPEKS